MPLVFIFVGILLWATVATLMTIGRLTRDTFRWVAALSHSSRSAAPRSHLSPRGR